MSQQTRITWHTSAELDPAGLNLIRSALRSNRRMKHASFELAAPDEVDGEGTVTISGNLVDKLIDPAEVRRLIEECLDI
jgi:hypothetical protein